MRIGRMFHRNAQTYLVHVFGRGLEGDRYVIEKYRSLADGQIHLVEAEQPGTNGRRGERRTIISAGAVKRLRPERDTSQRERGFDPLQEPDLMRPDDLARAAPADLRRRKTARRPITLWPLHDNGRTDRLAIGERQSGKAQSAQSFAPQCTDQARLSADNYAAPVRCCARAMEGRLTIAPVRGSVSTAARVPIAATAITANSAPKPQYA